MDFNISNSSDLPACFDISPAKLNSMSPSELVDAMEQAIDFMTEETYDPAVIDAYLDALDRKSPISEQLNLQTAHTDFANRVLSLTTIAEPQQRAKPSKRIQHTLRGGLVAALIAACLFGSIVIAQASGIVVFGAIAHWTERLFTFGPLLNDDMPNTPSSTTHTENGNVQIDSDIPEEFKELQHVLAERNLSLYFPRMTEGFEVVDSQLYINPATDNVEFSILYVQGADYIGFDLVQSVNPTTIYEKDATDVEKYQYSGVTHYIFNNITNPVAVWNVDSITYSVTTNMASINMEELIQSIYKE